MLRSLLTDLVRSRLWPIPVLALLVVVAAPLLFLRSEARPVAANATPAAADPARPTLAGLPTMPRDTRRPKTGANDDPFQPPSGHRAAGDGEQKSSAASTSAPGADAPSSGSGPDDPIPVVIQGGDGATPVSSAPAPPTSRGSGDRAAGGTPLLRAIGRPTRPSGRPTALDARLAAIDVRFGELQGSRLRRDVPRLSLLRIWGRPAAIFVKYSPARDKAVFAVAPGTMITGPVRCRRKLGVCRYLDIPAGSYARLHVREADGTLVNRRLDVDAIRRRSHRAVLAASRRARSSARATCLLEQMLEQRTTGCDD